MVIEKVQSLAEQAYDRLEALIVTLELKPGRVYSETELGAAIDIGRTPMREALQRLAIERLVTTIPRKGVMITDVNISEHLSLLETRRALDRLIAMKAARRANPDHREELRQCSDAIRTAAEEGDVADFMRLDRQFDAILSEASRNNFAVRAVEPLHAHCRRFWYMYQGNRDLRESAGLHGELMTAVADKDEASAGVASDQLMDYLDAFTRSALDLD